jgi:hypothetical protein
MNSCPSRKLADVHEQLDAWQSKAADTALEEYSFARILIDRQGFALIWTQQSGVVRLANITELDAFFGMHPNSRLN